MTDISQAGIRIVSGPDEGTVYPVSGSSNIGQHARCEIQLSDTSVASIHACIRVVGNGLVVADLTPESDLKVNGRVVKSRKLMIGDRISLGNTVIEVLDMSRTEIRSMVPTVMPDAVIVDTEDMLEEQAAEPEPVSPSSAKDDHPHKPFAEQGPPAAGGHEEVAEPPRRVVLISEDGVHPDLRDAVHAQQKVIERAAKTSKAPLLVALLLLVALSLGLLKLSETQRARVLAELRGRQAEIEAFAKANPYAWAAVLKRYEDLRSYALGKHSVFETQLAYRVRQLEQSQEAARAAYLSAVKDLDGHVDLLVSEGAYAEAIQAYETCESRMREQLLPRRKERIQEIRDLQSARERFRADAVVARAKALQEAKEAAVREAADKVFAQAADVLVIDGGQKAMELLKTYSSNAAYPGSGADLEQASSSAKLQASIEQKFVTLRKVGQDPTPEEADAIVAELPLVLRAVYAIRRIKFRQAQQHLAKAKGHVFIKPLLAMTQLSKTDVAAEEACVLEFVQVWKRVVGDGRDDIPPVGECVAQLSKAAEKEKIRPVCLKLQTLGKTYHRCIFVRRYRELFEHAEGLMKGHGKRP